MRVIANSPGKGSFSHGGKCGFLAAIIGLLPSTGAAQAIVNDPIHTPENVTTQITTRVQDLAKYEQMITNGKDQVQQQINTLNDLKGSLAQLQSFIEIQPGIQLNEVAEATFMVAQRCGSAGGGGFGGLDASLTSIDLRGNVFQQQYELCVTIQVMRNKQFNLTARYLKKSLETAQKASTDLRAMSSGTDQSGKKLDSISRLAQAEIELDENQKSYENEFSGYQKYIDIQMKTQSALAIGAMRGDPGSVGKITQAAALGLALCGGGKCDND